MDFDQILKNLSQEDQQKLLEFLGPLSSEQSHHNLDLIKLGDTTGSKSNVLTMVLKRHKEK
jgi:hypothetical protein